MSDAKLQRWTDLLAALLRRRQPATFDDLALDVPAYLPPKGSAKKDKSSILRTFERDKDELRAFGVPIETVLDADGAVAGYTLRTDSFYLPYLSIHHATGKLSEPPKIDRYGYRALGKMAFEPDELASIAAASARVQQLGDPTLTAAARAAARKLAFDLPLDSALGSAETREWILARERPDRRLFQPLNKALLGRKQITFCYRSMADGSTTNRTALPYGIFYLDAHWYLAAHDEADAAIKNFRLSRMSDLAVNAKKPQTPDFDVPASFSLRDHARSRQAWELGDADAVPAVVEFTAHTGPVTAALRLGSPVPDHANRRSFDVRREDVFVRWLLSFAGAARPVSPPQFVERFSAALRATLALYERKS